MLRPAARRSLGTARKSWRACYPARLRTRASADPSRAIQGVLFADLNSVPSRAAQAALLANLRARVEPLLVAERIGTDFRIEPGIRLRRAYGRCTFRGDGQQPAIAVRCTADGDRQRWRRTGAIMGTLLHEVAHLRYRSHGPRFWAIHRRLVDRAVSAGIYDPADRDLAERGRGDEKLVGSAARVVALAAREARLARARATRATRRAIATNVTR